MLTKAQNLKKEILSKINHSLNRELNSILLCFRG